MFPVMQLFFRNLERELSLDFGREGIRAVRSVELHVSGRYIPRKERNGRVIWEGGWVISFYLNYWI